MFRNLLSFFFPQRSGNFGIVAKRTLNLTRDGQRIECASPRRSTKPPPFPSFVIQPQPYHVSLFSPSSSLHRDPNLTLSYTRPRPSLSQPLPSPRSVYFPYLFLRTLSRPDRARVSLFTRSNPFVSFQYADGYTFLSCKTGVSYFFPSLASLLSSPLPRSRALTVYYSTFTPQLFFPLCPLFTVHSSPFLVLSVHSLRSSSLPHRVVSRETRSSPTIMFLPRIFVFVSSVFLSLLFSSLVSYLLFSLSLLLTSPFFPRVSSISFHLPGLRFVSAVPSPYYFFSPYSFVGFVSLSG